MDAMDAGEGYASALRDFGLSENEVAVYVTLLMLGEAGAHEVAKNAGIRRTTAYHILEGLAQKGLVSMADKEAIRCFQATSPVQLVEMAEDKAKRLREILPQLAAFSSVVRRKPRVQVYDGMKGIKAILDDILNAGGPISLYGDLAPLQTALRYHFPQFIIRRVKRNIPIRIVGRKEPLDDELLKTAKAEFREHVFLPDDCGLPSTVFIYGEKVAVLSLKTEPHYGIVIDDKDFHKTQKEIFDLLWKMHGRKSGRATRA